MFSDAFKYWNTRIKNFGKQKFNMLGKVDSIYVLARKDNKENFMKLAKEKLKKGPILVINLGMKK